MQLGTQEVSVHSIPNPGAASGARGKGEKPRGTDKDQKYEGKGA